jgi:hypothetical protein
MDEITILFIRHLRLPIYYYTLFFVRLSNVMEGRELVFL